MKTICSWTGSEKNSCNDTPKMCKMSSSVAMEGEQRSFSNCDMYPFVSSVRCASSSCVRSSFNRYCFIFFPISTIFAFLQKKIAPNKQENILTYCRISRRVFADTHIPKIKNCLPVATWLKYTLRIKYCQTFLLLFLNFFYFC